MADKIWLGGDAGGANSLNVAGNWSPSGVPSGGDNVWITERSTNSILNDLGTLASVHGELHVTDGFAFVIGGTTRGFMEMKPAEVYFEGRGVSYIDCKASTGVITVNNTKLPTRGVGLKLKGSALNTIEIHGGSVGLAYDAGETSAVDKVRIFGGALTLGEGVSGTTSISVTGGTLHQYGGSTDTDVTQTTGNFYGRQEWKARNFNLFGGLASLGGSGVIKSLTIRGGTADATASGIDRTFPTVTLNSGTIRYDPSVLTITALNSSDRVVKLTASSV